MDPAQPPFPTPSNFPFQPERGSHTSMRISESDEGVSFAVTRQNAGSLVMTSGARVTPSGGTNPPGATSLVDRMDPFFRGVARKSSQDVPPAATLGVGSIPASTMATAKPNAHCFMWRSLQRPAAEPALVS